MSGPLPAVIPEPAVSPGAIGYDLPCASCAYNLRGLTRAGRCPECGFEIGRTLSIYLARAEPLPPPERAVARQGVEGAVVSLLALGLMWVPAAVPADWYFVPYSRAPVLEAPARVFLLGTACAAWVLAWYAGWKLTRGRSKPQSSGRASLARPLARWGLSLYLLVPFLLPLVTHGNAPAGGVTLLLALLVAGGVGDAALFVHVASLFRRSGWERTAIESMLLSVASPAMLWFSLFIRGSRGGITSLDQMLSLPVCPYGVIYVFREVFYVDILRGDFPHPILLLFLAGAAWSASLLARLFICLRPFARRSVNEVKP
jgi:hypothetical protein